MTLDDRLVLAEARAGRWLPARRLRSIAQAGRFIEAVGFALLFPTDRLAAPSLFEAVAGPDAEPWAQGMGPAESTVWTWKDALPEAGLAWYGRFLHRRASLLSPRLLAALYPGDGHPDDHRQLSLSPEAHRIADALLTGPLPTPALRELIGHRGRYDRAVAELQRHLLVSSAGILEQRTGWPAVVLDLTCRLFEVGDSGRQRTQRSGVRGQAAETWRHSGRQRTQRSGVRGQAAGTSRHGRDHRYAARRYLQTVVAAKPVDLARAYGWTTAAARAALDDLVDSGGALRSADGYRAVE